MEMFSLAGRVPPLPHPGKTDPVLSLQGHHSHSLQSPGLPRQTSVRLQSAGFLLSLLKLLFHNLLIFVYDFQGIGKNVSIFGNVLGYPKGNAAVIMFGKAEQWS